MKALAMTSAKCFFSAALLLCSISVALAQGEGVLTYKNVVYIRPPFYKGGMPLNYLEGKRSFGSGFTGLLSIIYWQQFQGWRNTFSYDSTLTLERATAEGPFRRILARATLQETDPSSGRIVFTEEHYDARGRIAFKCRSVFALGSGFKLEESGQSGKKHQEYFFLLPV